MTSKILHSEGQKNRRISEAMKLLEELDQQYHRGPIDKNDFMNSCFSDISDLAGHREAAFNYLLKSDLIEKDQDEDGIFFITEDGHLKLLSNQQNEDDAEDPETSDDEGYYRAL